MTSWRQRIRVVGGAAALSGSLVMVCAWPLVTQADDMYEDIEQQQRKEDWTFRHAERHGALLVTSRLVPGETKAARWTLEVLVKNTTDEGAEAAQIEACIQETQYNPMSRGAPPPTVAWSIADRIEVPPGEVVIKRHTLPRGLSWRVTKAEEPLEPAKLTIPRTVSAFESAIVAVSAPSAPAPAA